MRFNAVLIMSVSKSVVSHGPHIQLSQKILFSLFTFAFGDIDPYCSRKVPSCLDKKRPILAPIGPSLVSRRAAERQCQTNDNTQNSEQDIIDSD